MSSRRRALTILAGVAPVLLAVAVLAWRYDFVYVRGGSMEPALSGGDLVVVDPHAQVKRGDVVLFHQPGHSPVLHRAVRRWQGGWETKGDANPVSDRSRTADSWIRGPVSAVAPLGDVLVLW